MAMITIGAGGFLNLNADQISSVRFEPGEWDRFTRSTTTGSTVIEMRNGTRHTLGAINDEGQRELIRRISKAQNGEDDA